MNGITVPNPPSDRGDPLSQAWYLAGLIKAYFDVTLQPQTVNTLRSYLARVGGGNQDDLVAAIFLECWQAKKSGSRITDEEVSRAADRVRQRLVREAKRVSVTIGDHVPAVNLPPDEEANLVVREFHAFLSNRSAVDAILFQRFYLDNIRDVNTLSEELGLSSATIYRKLAHIRSDYLAIRDLRQPPHAAD